MKKILITVPDNIYSKLEYLKEQECKPSISQTIFDAIFFKYKYFEHMQMPQLPSIEQQPSKLIEKEVINNEDIEEEEEEAEAIDDDDEDIEEDEEETYIPPSKPKTLKELEEEYYEEQKQKAIEEQYQKEIDEEESRLWCIALFLENRRPSFIDEEYEDIKEFVSPLLNEQIWKITSAIIEINYNEFERSWSKTIIPIPDFVNWAKKQLKSHN